MKDKKTNKFPKEFFVKSRPEVEQKETLKDIIPVKWKKKEFVKKENNKK